MRFRLAQTAGGPLESHSHIPPRNATLYSESPSYSATSGDPKPENDRGFKQDRAIMSDGCVSTAVRRLQFFFFEQVMREEVCLDSQKEQGRAAGRMQLK